MKPNSKDIVRTIRKEIKRFVAMAVIAILGITMFSGLQAGCDDLRLTADEFFDQQNLHDVYIQSTLGLTQDDVDAIAELEDVEVVTGFYTEEVQTIVDASNKVALIKVINQDQMDVPYLLEGRMPTAADEIVVTQSYMDESKKELGNYLVFSETDLEKDQADNEEIENESDQTESGESEEDQADEFDYEIEEDETEVTFENTIFKIVGVVIDPTDINAAQGSTSSFRSTANYDYIWYVLPEAVNTDIYTGIGITITGLKDIYCYSDEYDARVHQVTQHIADTMKADREIARTKQIKDDAYETIAEAEREMEKSFKEAEEEFADALAEIEDGQAKLDDAQAELDSGLRKGQAEIASGRNQINSGYARLQAGDETLAASEAEITAGEKELAESELLLAEKEQELEAGQEQIASALAELEAGQAQLEEAKAQLEVQEQELSAQWETFNAGKEYMEPETAAATEAQLTAASQAIEAGKAELASQEASLQAGREELETQSSALEAGKTELEAGKAQLEAAKQELASGRSQLEAGKAEAASGRSQLNSSLAKLQSEESRMYEEIAAGQAEIDEGLQELEEGRAEYDENWEEYLEKRADAEEEIADAKQEVEDIEDAKWYIQNRYSLSGYNNIKNDMSAIESLGIVFAFIFLIVAVLISLTTVTRMVEEDRGLIGTYQALGYSNREIRRKYLSFALFACLIGCVVGEILGFIGFPKVLAIIFKVMYQLPQMHLSINWLYFFAGPIIFLVCIAAAVLVTCHGALNHMPASLMRPKAPKAGSRVFLEYIPFIWKKMSFLNKVTARNLFRYKKRFFMTVIGIAGCMAILICGFGIKDTVVDLMTRQYDDISLYSWMGVVDPDDKEELDADLEEEASVESYMSLQVESVSLVNDAGETMLMPMYVIPDDADLSDYIFVEDIETGETLQLSDDGIIVTRNASIMLKFNVGDTLTIQDMQYYTNEYQVSAISENYLGNTIFISQSLYENTFGNYEENACLAILNEDGQAFIDKEAEKDMMQSAVSTQALKDDFSTSFALINMVVYIIIVMAAALAFVVLFTLSTTNISERERELATIKVLGFFDREVHQYVNKETIILTIIGIFCGIPLGIVMLTALTNLLKMPELYFAVSIHPITYLISGLLSFVFALVVNLLTNRTLNEINPAEALKSIE